LRRRAGAGLAKLLQVRVGLLRRAGALLAKSFSIAELPEVVFCEEWLLRGAKRRSNLLNVSPITN